MKDAVKGRKWMEEVLENFWLESQISVRLLEWIFEADLRTMWMMQTSGSGHGVPATTGPPEAGEEADRVTREQPE